MKYSKVERTDKGFLSRVLTLRVKSKTILTPVRAVHLTQGAECESRSVRTASINELFRSVTPKILHQIDGDLQKQQQFTASLVNAIQKNSHPDALNILFFSYAPQEGIIPSRRETEYLFDLMNIAGADLLVPPIVQGSTGESYLQFLDQFFTVYETINHRPIMGLIPYVSHRELEAILKFYEKQSISLFAMDLYGRHPLRLQPNITRVLRYLRKLDADFGEPSYLHGLNVGQGRALASQLVKPAKDMLTFEMGFDSFGRAHVPPKLTPDLYGKLGRAEKPPIRLFNRADYGYYVASGSSLRNLPIEKDAIISTGPFRRPAEYETMRKLEKAFNAERQVYETQILRDRIGRERTLEHYLTTKIQVRPMLKILSRLASVVKQTTL